MKGTIKAALTLATMELKNFWSSPAAGLALLVFLGLEGFFFYNIISTYYLSSISASAAGYTVDAAAAVFSRGLTTLAPALMLITPLVTMKSFSPAKRGGHHDFLETLPISDSSLILGQFLAGLLTLGLLLLLSCPPFISLIFLGVGSWLVLFCAYLGLFLLAASFVALGLFMAARLPSPIAAGLATLGLLAFLWLLGWASPQLDDRAALFIQGLAFGPKIDYFALGLLSFKHVLFFAALSLFGLINCGLGLKDRRESGRA